MERLDPLLRFPRLPRGGLLRLAAAAALLALAAGVLLTGTGTGTGGASDRPGGSAAPTCRAPAPAVSSGLPRPPPGTVGLPLRLADAGVAAVARPGTRVDVLVGTEGVAGAETLAGDVLVLGAPPAVDTGEGALLYVAVTAGQARRLAGVAAGARITVTVRAP